MISVRNACFTTNFYAIGPIMLGRLYSIAEFGSKWKRYVSSEWRLDLDVPLKTILRKYKIEPLLSGKLVEKIKISLDNG